jgi:glycosyltransferase involved in cell wall biosynthesis
MQFCIGAVHMAHRGWTLASTRGTKPCVSTLPPDFTLLQVVPALNTGGVEQTTLDVAGAVVRAGGRAIIASAGGRLEIGLVERGAEAVHMPLDSKNPLVLAANAGRLEKLIRGEGVSLVHVRSRAPAFSAIRAARRSGVPTVTTYHGVYNARSALKRWYNGVMTRGDLTIANSEFTRDHLIREHRVEASRVVAIPRGVDLARFDPALVSADRVTALRSAWRLAPDERRRVVLLAGRLTRWKGQVLLVEALAELRRRTGRDDIVLVLAGDDQGRTAYRNELEDLILNRELEDSVRIVGHVRDMPAAYLAADVAAAPSLDPEAFGRTAVEPQAMGRPVLAADHGAVRETVVDGETGWRVTPRDVEAWAAALQGLIDAGPDRFAAMGEAGRARARTLYSVDRMTDLTLQVYRQVLETHGR